MAKILIPEIDVEEKEFQIVMKKDADFLYEIQESCKELVKKKISDRMKELKQFEFGL